jgi:hypothetical protein
VALERDGPLCLPGLAAPPCLAFPRPEVPCPSNHATERCCHHSGLSGSAAKPSIGQAEPAKWLKKEVARSR